jgi:amino acid transporter
LETFSTFLKATHLYTSILKYAIEAKMKIEKAIDYIRTKVQENKQKALNLLSLAVVFLQQQGQQGGQGGLETIANNLQGLFTAITLICWAFVGIKLLTGYGLLSLPFASRMMKERGHRESEESIGASLLIAIGVTLITIIISIVGTGFKVNQPPWAGSTTTWNK